MQLTGRSSLEFIERRSEAYSVVAMLIDAAVEFQCHRKEEGVLIYVTERNRPILDDIIDVVVHKKRRER